MNIAVGVLIGILIASNSEKTQAVVEKGKKSLKEHVNKL